MRTLAEIGKRAGIKVASAKRRKNVESKKVVCEVVKYASAHDLRLSFGERWAKLVMPQTLMVLMRHEPIEKTLRYYVGHNAQGTAEVLWQDYRQFTDNKFGIKGQKPYSGASRLNAATYDTATP